MYLYQIPFIVMLSAAVICKMNVFLLRGDISIRTFTHSVNLSQLNHRQTSSYKSRIEVQQGQTLEMIRLNYVEIKQDGNKLFIATS